MFSSFMLFLILFGFLTGTASITPASSTSSGTSETTNVTSIPSTSSGTSQTTNVTSIPSTSSGTSDSVICFQCSASSPDEPCVTDTADMANVSTRDIFVKNCTDTNPKFDRCMIQTVESGGKIEFYHRDCHDGKYFPLTLNSSRFHGIATNNLSTCDLVGGKVVCYRPCKGYLCNGPRPLPNKTDNCPEDQLDQDEGCGVERVFITTGLVSLGIIFSLVTDWFRNIAFHF